MSGIRAKSCSPVLRPILIDRTSSGRYAEYIEFNASSNKPFELVVLHQATEGMIKVRVELGVCLDVVK